MSGRGMSFLPPAIALTARLVLGVILLYSSVVKLRQPFDFLETVYSFAIVGPKLGLAISTLLPWIELIVAICLLLRVWLPGALLTTIGLMVMFVVVQAYASHKGLSVHCGCFGASGSESDLVDAWSIARTSLLLVTAFLGYGASLYANGRAPSEARMAATAPRPAAEGAVAPS